MNNLLQIDQSELTKKILKLKRIYTEKGFFRPVYSAAVLHALTLVVYLMAAFFLLQKGGWVWFGFSIVLMGIYYPQAAYLAHELGHVAYTKNAKLNNFLGKIVGCAQGLSFSWWKHNHNLHHLHVNEYKIENGRVVPLEHGIEGEPLIVWDYQLISAEDLKRYRWWIRLQPYTIWPLFSLTRINWIRKGLGFAWRQKDGAEILGIITHYVAFFLMAWFLTENIWGALLWLLCSNLLGSLLFTTALVANHTCKEIRMSKQAFDYFENQVNSTRNLTNSLFLNWFMGGLNLQIEHHFFPKMPTYNLSKVAADVRTAVESSGLTYDEKKFFEVIKIIYKEIPV